MVRDNSPRSRKRAQKVSAWAVASPANTTSATRPNKERGQARMSVPRCGRAHRGAEHITFGTHGLDVSGLARIVSKTPAQAADQQIDGAVERVGVAALRQIQQLV